MADFPISTRDHEFICEEWLDLEPVFEGERYRGWSVSDVNMLIAQMSKVAREVIFPTRKDSDTVGVQFRGGKVTLPPSTHTAYWSIQESGWGAAADNEESGGALPITLQCIFSEYLYSANPGLGPYVGLTAGAARLIQKFGEKIVKEMFLEKMYSGKWAGTMCITEPDCGSDMGDLRTKAYPTDDPRIFKIRGSKCFISGGDQDITENIIHLVLARVQGAASGTKGVSLFVVPKICVDQHGNLGEGNDVATLGIEHKMGLKGAATAALNFGDNDGCRGILLGSPPDAVGRAVGMAQMFEMVNGGRVRTGVLALGIASSAYAYAVQYAKTRVQGRPFTNPKTGRVPIINHEDVRRMLLNSKSLLEAMRALCLKTAYLLDLASVAQTQQKRTEAIRRLEVNTPLIKAYCSDMAWQIVSDAIQVHGGYGYSEEYPVAQCARDVKVFSIWEGTNFIQSLDLVGRKFRMDKNAVFENWMAEIKENIVRYASLPDFAGESAVLNKAWHAVKSLHDWSNSMLTRNPALVPLYSTRILHSCAMLICGQLLLDQAYLSKKRIAEVEETHCDYPFYVGKVKTACYYIRNIVPNVMTLTEIIKDSDTSPLEIPEESF